MIILIGEQTKTQKHVRKLPPHYLNGEYKKVNGKALAPFIMEIDFLRSQWKIIWAMILPNTWRFFYY